MTAAQVFDDDTLPRCFRASSRRTEDSTPLPLALLVITVLMPFATGYFLSFVFRQINLVIAAPLHTEFGLSGSQLGLMTSMYFLAFALVLLPLGAALDRHGPRCVQSLLMLVAAAGAAIFARADTFHMLLIGRAVIGIGVAVALMAGLKAIVLWVQPERMALANGSLVTFGSLGAVAATVPAEFLLGIIGWRGLFDVLAVLCILSALLIYVVVPERDTTGDAPRTTTPGVSAIYSDRRFWRIAPVATSVVAASWSLQGLWAVHWLADVEGLSRPTVVRELFVMAVALSAGGLLLGVGADRLRRRGLSPSVLLSVVAGVSIAAQLAIVLRLPVPTVLPWVIVAIVGASTVLGYAAVTELFPRTSSGRATAALNVLQMAGSFVLQGATGFIVALWPEQDGHPPAIAYQVAFTLVLGLQAVAMAWFLLLGRTKPTTVLHAHAVHSRALRGMACVGTMIAYDRAAEVWFERIALAHRQARSWRTIAIGSAILAIMLSVATAAVAIGSATASVHIVSASSAVSSGLANNAVPDALRTQPILARW
ncbi:MFS transporter [Hyphomicrobium sp. CS1BSMeth3]|uniref:MFS transporter n=1 Tax=Hyphomicrobium sp. CS1BSMeth3 TaxID=1892844 RepID=UPI0009309BB2|nr:MFS transporter [Hyphomicrobium sp. CS1BSMeth3]